MTDRQATNPKGSLDEEVATRLLEVIEQDIVPLTRIGVAHGNKIFGAAILLRSDLSLVVAETNNETQNPLWHGEINAINRFHELPARPNPKDCLFLATHEPCSLCLSGITWAGFDNFAYLFSHQDSADAFAIPYDQQILKAIYAVPDSGRQIDPRRDLYNRTNEFFTSERIIPDPERLARLRATYDSLSAGYQATKGRAGIPLA